MAGLVFSAVLLAAGRSSRMGRDKALLEVGGMPLWQRQREILSAAGAGEVLLSARPDQAWAEPAGGFNAVLHDALPDGGPLVGITAALERTAHSHLAVLAIDLPAMTPAWFSRLAEKCEPGVGWVGSRGGYFEPLAAIYPREMRWIAWEAIARDDYSVQRVVATGVQRGLLRVENVSDDLAPLFANWNSGGAPANALPSP